MKKRLLSGLLCLVMALALLPTAALALDPVSKIVVRDIDAPVVGAVPDTTAISGSEGATSVSTYVDHVTWLGSLDENGCFKAGVKYGVIVIVKIKDDSGRVFSSSLKNNKNGGATINGNKCNVDSWSEDYIQLGYTFSSLKAAPSEQAVAVAADSGITSAQAAEYSTEDGLTMTINSDEDWKKLTDDNLLHYSRLVLNNAGGEKDLQWFKSRMSYYAAHHIEEIWFAPGYDVTDYLYDLGTSRYLQYGVICSGALNRGDCYVVISDTTPATQYEDHSLKFALRTYSGDLTAAVAKGASAAKNPCTKHAYTQQLETADRVASYVTCTAPTRYYYSCANCGKCEYNKNHTFVMEGPGRIHKSEPFHDLGAQSITDAAYIGVNTAGQRVYWDSCYACGKTYEQIQIENAPADYKTSGMSAELTYAQYLDMVKKDLAARESKALTGTNTTNMFTVSGTAVSAKVSSWAQSGVNWAKQNGLVDETLLGSDYTKAMTRLQFCSVAVKMAEEMTGQMITPAPASTFTDTSNEYVLKAYAAGITSGTGDGVFSPNATLNRQQMAAFIYRALQYVKDNSTVRYTAYTSKLGSYSDSGSIASWASEPLAFMNALGLIQGTTGTTISPTTNCTIEQALIVANRSLDAGEIGWYLVRTDKALRGIWVGWFAPFKTANYDAALTYVPGEKYWATGVRTASQSKNDTLTVTDPYTGATLTAYAENFVAIREN